MAVKDRNIGEIFFTIQLSFTHSHIGVDELTRRIGIEPDRAWNVGEERTTPVGRRISGVFDKTYWSVSRTVFGKRHFFNEVLFELDKLGNIDFFRWFRQNGGEASVIIGLSGAENIGDVIKPENLNRLAELGFSLGIEVFPNLAP
ncbi:MAG: DUF4279 domain-containing protein [Rhizobiaceae bacterium]|nr:DUF4279 domain-containing protein [Rhizobiaceae bacterium]